MAACVAVEYSNEDRRECRKCGRLVTGVAGVDLRHLGETAPVFAPPAADAAAFEAAVQAVRAVTRDLPVDEEVARLAVEAVGRAGFLRRKRGPRMPAPRVVDLSDDTARRYDRDTADA